MQDARLPPRSLVAPALPLSMQSVPTVVLTAPSALPGVVLTLMLLMRGWTGSSAA